MKYVRISLDEDEYLKIKEKAELSNMIVSKYVKSSMLSNKKDKHIQKLYYFNTIIQLLELISDDIQKKQYHENNSKIFFYLYLIEQGLQKHL